MKERDTLADKRAPRPTIRDVSAAAGVSIKTVSRVLNNEKYVSAETKTLVETAMKSLHFRASAAARSLAGHRSHQVALICDNPNPWYVYEVQSGTRAVCQKHHVRMLAQPYDRNSPTLLGDICDLIDQIQPDGLILTPPRVRSRRGARRADATRYALLSGFSRDPRSILRPRSTSTTTTRRTI